MSDSRVMKFVTQEEANEAEKKRQEEWERVRRPGDPMEPPKEVYDPRPLYEKLKEQKDKAQEEYEEKFKFKNMIYKGLDEEEASFLGVVADQRNSHIRELLNRETEEVCSYRNAVQNILDEQERNRDVQLTSPTSEHFSSSQQSNLPQKSQSQLLAGLVVTKRKRKSSSEASSESNKAEMHCEKKAKAEESKGLSKSLNSEDIIKQNNLCNKSNHSNCQLSSLAVYSSSSDSDDNQ